VLKNMWAEEKVERRRRRHQRVRKVVVGMPDRLRLSVFRSQKNIYAQVINDLTGHTLVSASSLDKELKGKIKSGSGVEAAKQVGLLLGKRALAAQIQMVIFDRGGCVYHGRVKALAEGARESGLKF
jgi:large subunit ribosomal protein L18